MNLSSIIDLGEILPQSESEIESMLQSLEIKLQSLKAQLSEVAPDLFREYETTDFSLKVLRTLKNARTPASIPQNALYAKYQNAGDAITAHLKLVNHTLADNELHSEILAGGWLLGKETRSKNLNIAIQRNMTHDEGNPRKLKRFPSGKIGLQEWDEKYDHD